MTPQPETKPATGKTWRDKGLSPQERFELFAADPDASVEETEWPAIQEAYLRSLVPQALDILLTEAKRLIEAKIAAATEKASAADRRWFQCRPHRRLRVRLPIPDEVAGLAAGFGPSVKSCRLILAGSLEADASTRIRIPLRAPPGVEFSEEKLEAATDVELLSVVEKSLGRGSEGIKHRLREAVRAAQPTSKSKILAARSRRASTLH